jgi:hypothetical protein
VRQNVDVTGEISCESQRSPEKYKLTLDFQPSRDYFQVTSRHIEDCNFMRYSD